MLNAFQPLRPFKYPWSAVFGARGSILQPIVLTKADGTVFVNGDGNALTRGTRRVET
jgi:hypothetical protein